MTTIKISIDIPKIIDKMAKRYIEDFGAIDDRFYFMSGFISTVLDLLNNQEVEKEIIK